MMHATLILLALGHGGDAALHAGGAMAEGDPDRVVRAVYRSPHGERAYRLYLPPARDRASGGPGPLVVVLHGCLQDAEDIARGTRMDAHARDRKVAVLYPEQPDSAHPNRCWNWYEPEHQRRDGGEPALLAGMIRQVVDDRGLDPARVYVAGISAGGAMAAILAATYPDLVVGAASHSGVPFGAARGLSEALTVLEGGAPDDPDALGGALLQAMGDRARAVPLLVLHGDEDEVVSPRNADGFRVQWESLMEETLGSAPVRERYPSRPGATQASRIQVLRAADGRVLFESWRIMGLGHAWSGGSEEGTFTRPGGVDATSLILDFFLERRGDGPGCTGDGSEARSGGGP